MKLKKVLPITAMLLVALVSGCNKDAGMSSDLSSSDLKGGKVPRVAVAAVNLGMAGNFVILSTSGITDVSASTITGDIGTSPINGVSIGVPCTEVTGTIYEVDATYIIGTCTNVVTSAGRLKSAVGDMGTAYTNAAGRSTSTATSTQAYLNVGAGSIGGLTFTPGVYTWGSAVNIATDIYISGSSTDVFIFQVNGTLAMASAAKIILTGGAKASNIFWQVTGAVTLGTDSHFEGIILTAPDSYIAMQTGASINGRLLSGTAVTLEMNAVTQPPVTKGKK